MVHVDVTEGNVANDVAANGADCDAGPAGVDPLEEHVLRGRIAPPRLDCDGVILCGMGMK